METRNISLSLEEAKDWYNSNLILRDIALKAFTKEELETISFKDIKTFQDACKALNLDYNSMLSINQLKSVSRASVAMFKLNIIRKAINLGHNLHLTKNLENSYIYYPYNPFVTKNSTYYENEINLGEMEVIGKIKSKEKEYNVLGGDASYGSNAGLGNFISYLGVGDVDANIGFLGCANKDIAKHFSKYFGMLIIEAKYGDIIDFEIISKL